MLAELAAAEVCAWAEVSTPAIGITRFPERVDPAAVEASVASMQDPAQRREVVELFRLNRGKLAFCSRSLEGAIDVDPDTFRGRRRRDELLRTGPALFLLDAFIRNDDRQIGNPNLMWMHDRLVAIDHGHAFAGIHRAGTEGAALAARTVLHSRPGFERHILRKGLARLSAAGALDEAASRLEAVPDDDVVCLTRGWPAELDQTKVGEAPRLRMEEFLLARRAHARTIAQRLVPWLAK